MIEQENAKLKEKSEKLAAQLAAKKRFFEAERQRYTAKIAKLRH